MAEPVRRCAGCGRKTTKPELIRIVRLPSGEIAFDPEKKYEGRSMYFCPSEKCFETLMRRGAPSKLMKITLPNEVKEAITCYLSQMESVR